MDEISDSAIPNRRQLFVGAGVATAAAVAGSMLSGPAGAATPEAPAAGPLPLYTIYGETQARSPTGVVTIGNRWWMQLNPDKSRTLHSINRSVDGTVVREAIQSVTHDWRPIYGTCRLLLNGKPAGVISKYVDDKVIKSVFAADGVFDVKEFPAPPHISVGFHVGLGDAWHMASVLPEKGRKQTISIHTSSATWNAVTLGHGETLHDTVEYVGEEDVDVAGQALRSRMYLWYTSFGRTIKVWVHGENNIPTRMEVLKTPAEFTPGTLYSLKTLQYLNW